MKKSIAAITARAILGFFALGLALSLFAGCAPVLNGPLPELTESGPAAGTGRVVIRLGPKAEGARTLVPATAEYDDLSYTYTFTSEDKEPVSGTLTEGTATVDLAAGTWTLTVEGKNSEDALSLKGTMDIEVSAGKMTDVSVNMKGYTEAGAGNGTLSYTVTFPAAVSVGTLTVYRWDNDERQGTPADLAAGTDTDNDPDTKTVTGTIGLPAGYYRVVLDLYKADGIVNQTDIAHIYLDLTTEAPYTIAAGDFTPATVDSTWTSLAEVLGSVSGLASGANVTYVLPIGNETMSAASVSNTGPVTVTIDGGGREVTLDNSGGSLITVGDKVTLVLKNITLKGRGEGYDNTAALVRVENGGTLVMEDGSKISDNNRNYSNPFGGGVYVNGGTFTMNGGEIAGNTSASSSNSYGGGVYVASGTFTMNGGKIAGNTASATNSYGGGVYVYSGTFIMSGGEIAGNTASASHNSYGGGVYVASNGSFTMSGGEIAENTASAASTTAASSGGGVYVASNGSFTMNGGEIAGNTAYSYSYSSYSRGGGVYVYSGTFTMNGGEIAGNTADAASVDTDYHSTAHGGGVYVASGIFTMSGGKIAGNTTTAAAAASNSSGGGVYVAGGNYVSGTFTMSGGEIAGNTASSYGGGVYVSNEGMFTFTKSGGGTIYGVNAEATIRNTANSGWAVYVSSSQKRDTTVGPDVDLDSSQDGAAGGWGAEPPVPSTVTGIIYDDAWALQADGRRKSPAIGDNSVTKARVSFTATDNAFITIQLDVSSQPNNDGALDYDWAFISILDNGSATGSRISGEQSITVTIPVPTAGSHFVDIGYRKDGGGSGGSDCAWFKIVE